MFHCSEDEAFATEDESIPKQPDHSSMGTGEFLLPQTPTIMNMHKSTLCPARPVRYLLHSQAQWRYLLARVDQEDLKRITDSHVA